MSKAKILLAVLVTLLSVNVAFAQNFSILQDLGPDFYGILLPFVFTFAIVYALLQKTALATGNDTGKRVTVVVAMVMGLFVTALGGPELAMFFITLSGGAAMILAGILVILLLVALVGRQPQTSHMVVVAIIVVIGILLFLNATGAFVIVKLDSQLVSLIFVFIVLAAVAWFLYSADKGGGGGQPAAAPAGAPRQ